MSTLDNFPQKRIQKTQLNFIDFYEAMLPVYAQKFHYPTYRLYKYELKKIKLFLNGHKLFITEIDEDFLKSYRNFLTDKCNLKKSATLQYLKIIRKVFYDAFQQGLLDSDLTQFSIVLKSTTLNN